MTMLHPAPFAGLEHGREYRDRLFRAWVDAKRCAADSEDPADHAAVASAYTAFMRAHLTRDERDRLALEDEIARLTAENLRLRHLDEADTAPALPKLGAASACRAGDAGGGAAHRDTAFA